MFSESIDLLFAQGGQNCGDCFSTPKLPQGGCRVALDSQIGIAEPRDEVRRRRGIAANSQTDRRGLTDAGAFVRKTLANRFRYIWRGDSRQRPHRIATCLNAG